MNIYETMGVFWTILSVLFFTATVLLLAGREAWRIIQAVYTERPELKEREA